jgi:LacI family transcriptional regulator
MAAALKNSDEMALYQQMVGAGQVDGFILSGVRDSDLRLLFLDAQNIPYVAFGRSNVAKGIQVDVDGAAGMEKAVDYLVDLGHQRIGFITPPPGLMCTQHRMEGFRKAIARHHLQVIGDYIQPGDFQEKSGQVSMHLLLDLPVPPTAVIAANDICAFGAMNALKKRGLEPGIDISVVGFDDIRLASHWSPPLTTISQPYRKIGFKTANLLIDAIKGKQVDKEYILMPELMVRNSTGRKK